MFGYLQVISKTCCFPSLLYLGWSRVFCVLDIERERELQWGCTPNHFITLHIIISIYHRPWLLDFFGVVNHLSYRLGVPLCEMRGSTACDSWLCWVDRLMFSSHCVQNDIEHIVVLSVYVHILYVFGAVTSYAHIWLVQTPWKPVSWCLLRIQRSTSPTTSPNSGKFMRRSRFARWIQC